MLDIVELYFLRKIKYIQESNPHEQVASRTYQGNHHEMK
jgi:hypothetical protein